MALVFYRKRDIDEMDVNHIPEGFINYFESLDDDRKAALLGDRRDIGVALGFYSNESTDMEDDSSIPEDEIEAIVPPAKHKEDEDFAQIRHNRYESVDITGAVRDNMPQIEALTIPDGAKRCIVHRINLISRNIKYKFRSGAVRGVPLFLCPKCNRIFVEAHSIALIQSVLSDAKTPFRIYPLSLSSRYLHSLIPVHEFANDEILYIPDTWVEENPACPIHGDALYEIPCAKRYKDRQVSFTGFICDQCDKIMVRKAVARDLEDDCMNAGIAAIEYAPIRPSAPKKKPLPPKDVISDYIIENGKRISYTHKINSHCFQLTEDDTVVVSDSIYCPLEGHDSMEAAALVHVQEKKAGRKAYLLRLGYCTMCQKNYMEHDDYKVMYGFGRPEVNILVDMDDTDYRITSGDVFNLERKHLSDVEDSIKAEVSSIQAKPDYVSQYATFSTGGYDDGNLAWAKRESRRLYQPRLTELESYRAKPYLYRVDIALGNQSETYYIGAADVFLNGRQQVISANSDFGHALINYQSIKVCKDGKDYSIKLTRQFDIDRARLFGYTNLRTDEDAIFKSGITDPFLVRVLNMRKRQHNLTDIFVTIQENQNNIVNADFSANIIVQGCAGSGKTMVLLHRLSALQYRERHFDFSNDALILTPNDQFAFHIKGIAEELQIGNIARTSVQQYYMDLLSAYSPEFHIKDTLSSEMLVRQDFVDYIYSDAFKIDFIAAYISVMSERNALAEALTNLAETMEQPARKIDLSDDSKVAQQLRTSAEALRYMVEQRERALSAAAEDYKKLVDRKGYLTEHVSGLSHALSEALEESISDVRFKIELYQEQKQRTITQLEKQLLTLNTKRAQTQEKIQATEAKEREKREKQKRNLSERITSLSHTLKDTVDESIARASSRINQYQTQQQDEITRLETQLGALHTEQENVHARIQQLEAEEQERRNQRKRTLLDQTSALSQSLTDAVSKSLSTAKSKIEAYQSQKQREISAMEAQLESLRTEQSRVQSRFLPFGRRTRLNELSTEINAVQNSLEQERAKRAEEASVLIAPAEGTGHDDFLAWLSKVSDIIPEVKEEIQRCMSLSDRLNILSDEMKGMNAPIEIEDGSKERLAEIATEMRAAQSDLNGNKTMQAEAAQLFIAPREKASDDEILAWLLRVSNIIPDVEEDIHRWTNLKDEVDKLSRELISLEGPIEIKDGSKAKLARYEKDMHAVQDELDREKTRETEDAPVFIAPSDEASADELLTCFSAVRAIIPEVREEVRRCTNLNNEFNNATDELSTIDALIDAAEKKLTEKRSSVYPDAVKQMSENLCKEIEKYTITQTFQLVFDRAVLKFKTVNRVRRITGKYHRYDLYAMLLFSMRFFGRSVGTSRFLCVDEGQDLALNEYRLLYEINGRNVIFNVFGDTNQLMKQGRGISDWAALQKAFGAKIYTLNENYRNTNQITRFCNSSFDMNVTQTGVDGANVREISRRDLEKELAELNIGSERLAILVPRSVQKKQYLHQELLPPSIAKIIGEKIDNGCIALMYVDEVKGIEFDRAFVVCGAMSRSEKYIAYTRALSELILVIDSEIADAV